MNCCVPVQTLYFWSSLILKINKSNPFVSLFYLLNSNYFISQLSRMRINFYSASPRLGIEYLHAWNFFNFFQGLHFIASQFLRLWRKERTVTESAETPGENSGIWGLFSEKKKRFFFLNSTVNLAGKCLFPSITFKVQEDVKIYKNHIK